MKEKKGGPAFEKGKSEIFRFFFPPKVDGSFLFLLNGYVSNYEKKKNTAVWSFKTLVLVQAAMCG